MKDSTALILIDLQLDFFPGGALGVSHADKLFPLVNTLQNYFSHVIATKDWHPPTHKSFASHHPEHKVFDVVDLRGLPQVLWPDHCVPGTRGSEFHPELKTERIEKVIYKGMDPEVDSYSAFFDNAHQRETGLDTYLKSEGIKTLYFLGLATDYCVFYSALDALELGYEAFIIQDACFGINKTPGDVEHALATMREKGASLTDSQTLFKTRKILT